MEEHETIERLSAYAEGELTGADASRVETHVAGCAACAARLARLRALADATHALPRDIVPPGETWEAVRARVRALPAATSTMGGRRWWVSRWSLAAAAVLVVVVGGGIVLSNAAPKAKASKALPAPAADASAGIRAVRVVERSYAEPLAELRESLDLQRERLAPETVRILERSLAVIDSAIAEAREALQSDPANASLADVLSANYARKVDLLQRASRLSSS